MNVNPSPEDNAIVCVACGHLAAVPSSQLADYYRGQRWMAGLALALALTLLTIELMA